MLDTAQRLHHEALDGGEVQVVLLQRDDDRTQRVVDELHQDFDTALLPDNLQQADDVLMSLQTLQNVHLA